MIDRVVNIGAAIVTVAMVTTIVIHPASADVIRAVGEAFSSSIRAAIATG